MTVNCMTTLIYQFNKTINVPVQWRGVAASLHATAPGCTQPNCYCSLGVKDRYFLEHMPGAFIADPMILFLFESQYAFRGMTSGWVA